MVEKTTQRFRLGADVMDFQVIPPSSPDESGFVFVEDVQHAFKTDAIRFQIGTMVVPFMRGPSRRKYVPERIPCSPGGPIIDILPEAKQGPQGPQGHLLSPPSSARIDHNQSSLQKSGSISLAASMRKMSIDQHNMSQQPAPQLQLSHLQYNSNSTINTTNGPQKMQSQQQQHYPSQQQSQQHSQNPQQYQPTSLSAPHQAPAPPTPQQMAAIRAKIETILCQKSEMTEYNIPRLFIILPDNSTPRDPAVMHPSTFRIHFLCDCGLHSLAEKDRLAGPPHQLHMARHEGYVIQRPNEFFKRFSPYLIVMLEMIRSGLSVGGYNIPVLKYKKIVESIETLQEFCDCTTQEMIESVDYSLMFLDEFRKANSGLPNQEDGRNMIDYINKAEEIDLRLMASYLVPDNNDSILGNLYRLFTSKGDIKWVCQEHHHARYPVDMVTKLRTQVSALGGTYVEQLHKVTVSTASSAAAKQTLDTILFANLIELELEMAWNQEFSEFTKLKECVQRSKLVALSIDLKDFPGPGGFDLNISGSRRYDPIFELMGTPTLKSATVRGLPADVWKRYTAFPRMAQLKVLQVWNHIPEKELTKFKSLLVKSPNTTHIRIKSTADDAIRMFNLIAASRTDKSPPALVQFINDLDMVWFQVWLPTPAGSVASTIKGPFSDWAHFLNTFANQLEVFRLGTFMTEIMAMSLSQSIGSGNGALSGSGSNVASSASSIHSSWSSTGNMQENRLRQVTIHDHKFGDKGSQAIARLVAKCALTSLYYDIRTRADLDVAQDVQWKSLEHLVLNNALEDEPSSALVALRNGMLATRDRIALDVFSYWEGKPSVGKESFEILQDIMMVHLSGLEHAEFRLRMDPEMVVSLLQSIDFSRLSFLLLYCSGFDEGMVQRILDAIPHDSYLDTLILYDAQFSTSQFTQMQRMGITLLKNED